MPIRYGAPETRWDAVAMSSPDTSMPANALSAGEVAPPGEADAVRIIAQAIEVRVRAAAKTGPARRDAHPKAHGCVKAEFRVLGDLAPALRVGVFASPRTFEAWI